jgi:CheY-like chemotaxis protein
MLKVLIAEDDMIIASEIEKSLGEYGYEVCGIASTVAEAIALGRLHKPDLAILDMQLAGGGVGTDIALQLDLARLGILYATGYTSQVLLSAADGDACLAKPYRAKDLMLALNVVAGIISTGIATPPFPSGFQLLDGAIHIGASPHGRC